MSFLSVNNNISPANANIAESTSSTIRKKRVMHAIYSLSLNDVLFILKFSIRFLFISKLTTQNRCCTIFYPFYSVFQDMHTGMIGSSREYSGLYYLDDGTLHSHLAAIFLSDTPLQWHHR